jgi:alkanesulfonate monooxygenase SsuD/methylene tetrahydromethanopterin reductase-like flavin-dependent oxidoreductase (luciferase family)
MMAEVTPPWQGGVHPWVAEQTRRVRFGIATHPRADWSTLRSFVQEVEALGFDSVWFPDHPVWSPDCFVTLAAIAGVTERLCVGTSVACVYYRDALLIARAAADVARVSDGRLVLGLGIGDRETEFVTMGIAHPPVSQRQQALAETVQAIRGLWKDGPFSMPHAEANVRPGPVQRPYVPLLIAGGGERVTLHQVAHYADMCNFGAHPITGGAKTEDDVRRKLGILRRYCEALGRPYESVLRSHVTLPLVLARTNAELAAKLERTGEVRTPGLFAGTVARTSAYYRGLVAAGMRYFVVTVRIHDRETLRMLGELVLPKVEE